MEVSASMSTRWKSKRAQLKNLESAREAKRRDVSRDANQEVTVLSSDTVEQQGFISSAQSELVECGGVREHLERGVN